MKKKYYTVFFASERNDYSRSFQLSKLSLRFLSLFGIILIGLAILGGLRIANQEPLTRQLGELKNQRNLMRNIINDLKYGGLLDSTKSYAEFVAAFYLTSNLDFPDIPPVKGYVTKGMNIEDNHLGVDVAAQHRDEINIPADGKVVFSGVNEHLGNTVIVTHPGGFITVYGHNDTNLVSVGDEIAKGKIIAKVGDTGISQGPHLHFEIWKNDQVLDPREIIPEYKEKDVSIR